MNAKRLAWVAALAALLLAAAQAGLPQTARAQYGGDDLFQEEGGGDFFGPQDDPFFEDTGGDEFGAPQDDFTEGGEFVEEEEVTRQPDVTAQGRTQQLRTLGEREMLPMNAAWGAGTGLLLGGWYALVNAGTNRETQRSLGLGIVLGTVLGITVGTRSLIAPDAPQPVGQAGPPHPAERGALAATPMPEAPLKLSYTFRF